MNNFLTKDELTILSKGLELYENDPHTAGMITGMMKSVIMAGSRSSKEAQAEIEADMKKAQAQVDARKLTVARLRVKLMEMAMQPSEFSQ